MPQQIEIQNCFDYVTQLKAFIQRRIPESMRKYQFNIPANERPKRLDHFVTHAIENLSRSRAQQLVSENMVSVNGKFVAKSYMIRPGDRIEVILPLPEKVEAQAEDIPIRVIYEDDDILVVNKSAGMVVHPAYANYTGTLVNALLHHVQDLSGINGELRPGIVHRIDKDTSGLLLVAKHDRAHRHLSKLFKDHNIEREYWAMVWGKPKKKKDTIETLIGRSAKDRKKFAVTKEGKNAITHYELITAYESVSLIRCRLETGRTHQIRVHMNYIGHPILGDKTYGGDNPNLAGGEKKKKQHAENILALIPRQALHAKTLGFIHPTTKKMMRFDSELPDDFNAVLQLIK